jgi:AcrR family transcriptional regulator
LTARRRDSRALIAAAARSEFAAHGYAGGRVERIARRAGVNKQLIFYYFGSKAGLYRAVIERAAGEAVPERAAGGQASHAAGELRRAFNALFDSFARQPELTRLLMLDAQASGAHDRPSHRAVREFLSRMRALITQGQGHGYFRDDVDPDRMARQSVVLALGYFMLEPILEGPPDPGRASEWRTAAADLLLRALAW